MEKIRIFYAADLHGDFDSLKTIKKYLEGENFDIRFINGDILHLPFSEKELEAYFEPYKKAQELEEDFVKKKIDLLTKLQRASTPALLDIISQETFDNIKEDQITEDGELTDMELYALAGNPGIPLESGVRSALINYSKAREKIKDFQKNTDTEKHEEKYAQIAEKNMIQSYKEFKKMLSGLDYLTLPGNHDGKCLEEILGGESLHQKTKEIKGIKIAGYGGSTATLSVTPSILTEFVEGYIEQDGEKIEVAEAELFFIKEKPDIVVTHEIPLGAIPKVGHPRLGIYIAQKNPSLVLAAHMHEFHGAYPFQTNDKSILVMPGKLGKIEGKYSERHNKLKTFAEIGAIKEKDGLVIDKVTIKKLTDKDEIKTLSEYYPNNL